MPRGLGSSPDFTTNKCMKSVNQYFTVLDLIFLIFKIGKVLATLLSPED